MRAPTGVYTALLLLTSCAPTSSHWALSWSDEFTGTTINATLWNVLNNTAEGRPPSWNQIELYTADNVFLDAGALVLRTRPDNITFDSIHYNVTSGRVDTSFKANITYGRVEVSAQLQNDAASGIHTAHWLLGYGCWPNFEEEGGEIDIMECQSPHNVYATPASSASWQVATSNYHIGDRCSNETRHTTGTSEYPRAPIPGLNFSSSYNTFAVEWNATDLVYFVNEERVNHVWEGMPGWSAPFRIPNFPMFLILSQAYMAHRPLGNPPAWAWPVEQRIDYVRVYTWVP
jgi:beta-glucanase (GH16 family)